MSAATAAIVLNAAASSAGSKRVRRAIELLRRRLATDLLTVATRDADELADWLRTRADGYRTVIVAGGDGTLGVACNVFAGRDVVLGYLPAGFGNAAAHLLRLPRDPVGMAAAVAAGDARPVDLVRVGGRLALFAGAGWDALVAGRYADAGARGALGWAAAIAGAVPALWRRPAVRLHVQGAVVYEGPMELLVASTTPYFGRGLLVNPGARSDSGRLRLRLYPGPAPALALQAVRWVAHRSVTVPRWDATTAELEIADGEVPLQADGDRMGEAVRWSFSVEPRAVRLIGRWTPAAEP